MGVAAIADFHARCWQAGLVWGGKQLSSAKGAVHSSIVCYRANAYTESPLCGQGTASSEPELRQRQPSDQHSLTMRYNSHPKPSSIISCRNTRGFRREGDRGGWFYFGCCMRRVVDEIVDDRPWPTSCVSTNLVLGKPRLPVND